ncbi:hypothetical protein [Mycolicibacterium bacteremicum]|uniref:hypothetical protein n=1 Tax=Mycolicibacterium bacteremicum TaxID=564198 RepID=UPI0026EADDB9|nr:hypothetical protein [Mycolicibacterium bacteremicum]
MIHPVGALGDHADMQPFIGSEALAAGTLTRGVLRARYTAILPNVYVPKGTEPTLEVRAKAAWLWSGRTAIIAGRTAVALYGRALAWNSDPVELIAPHSGRPPGVAIRNERISVDEVTIRLGLPITTPVRTALDLARHLERDEAVTLLDPFTAACGLTKDDIWRLAKRYRGTRSIRTADRAIVQIDPGARTPEQTRVRLMLSDRAIRPTHSQIRITDGWQEALVAMGWPALKVGVGCDLADVDPAFIIRTSEFLQSLGWLYIPVLPQHDSRDVCRRVWRAVLSRTRRT